MEKFLKKRFVRTLLIVYFLSYILHDFFFINITHAESPIQNTNLVAVIVDKKLYDNNAIKNKIERYATDYIQQKISDSKAIVLPINIDGTNGFKAQDIVKMLENMYFDGIKDAPSKLVGLVLIGDIPLPVVEYNTFVYPSIYPYVDFEDQEFVYSADKGYFSYNGNPNGQAEIRHGIIKFQGTDTSDEISKYEKFFKNLQNYNQQQTDNDTGTQFAATKIRYDDFVATKEYFLTDNTNYYVNNFLFTEDVGYRRFTNMLLDTLKGEHNKVVADATDSLTTGLNALIPSNPDADEQAASDFGSTIQTLMDKFNQIMGDMGSSSSSSNNQQATSTGAAPSSKSPTLMLKAMTEDFLKGYDTLLATKYLTRMRDDVKAPARRYQADADGNLNLSFDSHYNKIVLNDVWAAGDLDNGISPLLIQFNNKLEEALNGEIESEKYYMDIPVLTQYYNRSDSEEKNRSVYENFYFGKKASEITNAQDFSAYRGTYSGLQNVGSLSGVTYDAPNKTIGGSYKVFSQQIEANRGYDLNNAQADVEKFTPREVKKTFSASTYGGEALVNAWKLKKNVRKEKNNKDRHNILTNADENGTSEGGQDVINKNRGGATPLNLDNNNKLKYYSYRDARQPIYDIAGSDIISGAQPTANSYLGYLTFDSVFKTKIDNGNRAYIYPRALTDGGTTNDQATLEHDTAGNPLAFVHKIPYLGNTDFFQIFYSPGLEGPSDNHRQYIYKTIDSRVYNISPTPEQVNGTVTNIYGSGSDSYNLYTDITNEITSTNSGLVDKETACDSPIHDLQNEINNLDIATITNCNVSGYTGNITNLANTRNTTITTSGYSAITGNIEKTNNGLQEMDNYLISSRTETIYYNQPRGTIQNTGNKYTASLSIAGALDAIAQYKIDNGTRQGFLTLITGSVALLSGEIDNISEKIANLENNLTGATTRKNTSQNNLNALITDLSGKITSLNTKKNSINQLEICGTLPSYACGCANTYSALCNAIDGIRNKLFIIKAKIFNIMSGIQTKEYDRQKEAPTETVFDDGTGLESDTRFDRINFGINYHNSPAYPGLKSEIQSLRNDVSNFTRIETISPTDIKKSGGMDMTTRERPIDNTRNVTFEGIGGGLVKFNYPNLYEVETFKSGGNNKLVLKQPDEIAQAIKNYLTGKVAEYNTILNTERNNRNNFYAPKAVAFNSLGGLANPMSSRPYNLMNADFFIKALGTALNETPDEAVNTIAKLMYYQNITRQEKQASTGVIDDINNTKAAFDINKKISYVMQNYLSGGNDQGPLVTPTYSTGGYEVAFINSDSQDYIKAKPTPTAIQDILTAQENKSSNTLLEAPTADDPIADTCKFDPSGSELIFDVKTLSSPRLKAMKCRFTETMKNPFKVKVDFSDAMGPTLQNFAGQVDQSVQNRQGSMGQYASQRGALDTDTSNQQTIANATATQQATLNDINTYTKIEMSSTGQDQATSRQLGNQTIGKQLRIWSTRDLGTLDIKVQATGDNCLGIKEGALVLSNNLCTKNTLTFNPSTSPKNLDVFFNSNKAGTTIVTVEFCVKNTNTCIKKASKIEILADPLAKATIKATSNEVIAGGEVPISVRGQDQYGNTLGLIAPEVMLSTLTGEGQIRSDGALSNEITFSDFGKTSLSYVAPSEVANNNEMQTTIYFSGISQQGGNLISITTGYTMNVIKGFLDIYFQSNKVFEHNNVNSIQPINISLDGKENITSTGTDGKIHIDTTLVPKITLSLKDNGGLPLTRVQSIALISTQNKLLMPGEISGNTFINNGSFILSGGILNIYLYPSFQAGNDTLYVSVPGIDTIKIPIHVTAGKAQKVNVTLNKETAGPGESMTAKIKVTDIRDNPISTPTSLKIGIIGALSLSGLTSEIITATGENTIGVQTKEPGGESYIYAQIDNLSLDKQTPGYKDILVQDTLLPQTGLNIMYLNLFGTDWGNQRGYFSNNMGYVNRLMDQSDKLLAVTTQLIDPNKIRATDVIVASNGQVKNLAGKDISLQIVDKNLVVKATDIGTVDIGATNNFTLQTITATGDMQSAVKNKNIVLYIPEPTDSVITGNEIQNKKILINGQSILDLNDGSIADGVLITLSTDKTDDLSKRDVTIGDKKIGQLIISRKDTRILDNADTDTNITNANYDQKQVFAEGSTNGLMGIGLYQVNSSFTKEGYKSIEDNSDSTLGLGFTNNFKNITYFGDGKSVGESTQPFGSQFLVNFGDPLLKKVSPNVNIKANENITTDFDGGMGDPIYSDPTKPIFKVVPIDFNDDGLQDLLIVYKDGTIRLMKNYGGNTPYSKAQDLMVIADNIKDVIAGDVDGNQYPDIMIQTNSNKLKVYTNNKGVFDVDGKLVCLNANVKLGYRSNIPDDMSQINQIFFEDMDHDNKLDIVTNDNHGDIKIFYGGSDSNGANYLSTLKYTCDDGRYDREKDHMQIVRSLGIKIDKNLYVQNASLIRWKGLIGSTGTDTMEDQTGSDTSPFASNLDGREDSDPSKADTNELTQLSASGNAMAGEATGQAEGFVTNLNSYISQGLEGFTRYIASPIDQLLAYETGVAKEQILYAQAFGLSGDDGATVYKQFEDINGDVLEPGDQVLVTTTIGALKTSKFTYLEDMQLPGNSKIETTGDNNRITSFRFATGTDTGDMTINRDVGDPYEFMLDNIKLNAGDSLKFSYTFTYLGTPGMKIEVKDDDIATGELAYAYTQSVQSGNVITGALLNTKAKDKLPDIILYPTNSCKKYKLTLFNTDQGDKKTYQDIFFNIQQQLDDENAKLTQQTADNITDTNNAAQPSDMEGIKNIPGMDTVLESRNPQSIFSTSNNGIGLNMNGLDASTAKIQQKMTTALNGLCQGFSIGKNKSCQGIPVPFNQGFLAPGNYHLFGCTDLTPLTQSLGKGLPVIAFPTNGTIPIRPPIPSGAGGIFGGSTSQVRVYAVPTMTLGIGIAICLGPYSLGKSLPKPFRDIAGNCIVFSIPPITKCKDVSNNGGESDQVVNNYYIDAAQNGVCENPPQTAHNVIVFTPSTSNTVNGLVGTDNEMSSDSPLVTLRGQNITPAGESNNYPAPDTRQGNFFGLSLNQKPTKVNQLPAPNTAGAAWNPSATFDFGGGEKFELKSGEPITLKQVGSISKGLIKCIMKDRVDNQVMYILNNMTKLTVDVSFPDLSQLAQGRDQLSVDKFKTILSSENTKDISNGATQPLALSGAGILKGAKEIFSKQTFQNLSNQTSNPFDAIMIMFKEVPLINMNTKNINIKIPMIGSEDITKYIAYLNTRYETNAKILERRLSLVNNVLAFCGTVSKQEVPQQVNDLNRELNGIMGSTSLSGSTKNIFSGDIHKELKNLNNILTLTGDTTRQKFGDDFTYMGNNLQLTMDKIQQIPELTRQKNQLIAKKSASGNNIGTFTTDDEAFLQTVTTRLDKVNKCGDFVNGLGKFLTFYENTAGLIQSIKQNIKVLELYKTFPLQLYERMHVVDRYLTEVTSVFSDFLGSIMYRMKTNADRFSKYVDAIILIIGVMKTRQVLIDFSVNRSKKCGKCTNDDYSPQSCSLGFLCPKIPVLKIPNFRIPNLYIDLSHINLGINITLPNFNFKPVTITLPKIPNLPNPPAFEIFLNYDYGMDLDMGFFKDLNLPTIPILPSPPQLPDLPSFIPNVKITLPVIPPAPKVPQLSPKIALSIKIAEFISKVYCIIKGGIGLVGENGVKGKVEELTQRTRNVPVFDYFDLTAKLKQKPLEGFDYKLDAYLELKYNFDGFYSFLNNIVQPINDLSNVVEGVTQKSISETQTQLNNNDVINKFNNIQNFQIEGLNSYVPSVETQNLASSEEMLAYADAYQDVKKGLAIFESKADEKNDTQTMEKIKTLKSETEMKSSISPAYKELEDAGLQAQGIIKNKQDETEKLTEQIQNNYDGFIKSLKDTPDTLVKSDNFSTTISSPLFNADEKTTNFLQKQEDPNTTYIKLNKTVLDGYVKALDSQTPAELNMSQSTYTKSKQYLQDINDKINVVSPLIAYNDTNATTTNDRDFGNTAGSLANKPILAANPAPQILLAQNSNPPCPSCSSSSSTGAGYSADLSQFVKGVFVQVYSGDEKLMVNTVKSDENVVNIGQNYIQFDINNDGNHNDSDPNNDLSDIIMRDENNIYIKYASGQDDYGMPRFNTNYYVHEFDTPDDLWNNEKTEVLNDGYFDVGHGIDIKLADESREVKNFKMQGQDFESISFGWMNSGLMGDKADGYLIKLNQRIDTFNDKQQTDKYGMSDTTLKQMVNEKYVLLLPNETDTGGLISLKNGFPDKHPIQSFFTGDSQDAGTIIAIKFYDPGQEKINISLQEIPRTRQYAQIATLIKHQEKLSQSQAEKFGLYEIASARSNQIVAGRQLIGDTVGPVGTFTLYRPQVNETVGTGDAFEGFVSTHYTIRANRKDNVAVQAMRIEKNGQIIQLESGAAETGFIQLNPGLFYTGETKDNRYFGAQDFNGNVTIEQINLSVKIPELNVIGTTNNSGDQSTQVIAQLSNDLDEGNVMFQRERNGIRTIMTGTNGTSYFPLTGKQTIITGGIFSIGNTIGFYNMQGKEIGTLNPNNGRILIDSGFQTTIKVQLDVSSHIPVIKIFDTVSNTTLFQVNLPMENLMGINMQQGAPNYEKTQLDGTTFGMFNGGYCIKGQDDNCIIFASPQGQVYIPAPYSNSLEASYGYDSTNGNILYEIKDQSGNPIATFSLKFQPQQ